MSLFSYKAKKSTGEVFESEMESVDRFSLFHDLKAQNIEVISVKEIKPKISSKFSFSFMGKIKAHDKIIFAQNLGSMISAGLSVSRALTVMERQSTSSKMKKILVSLNNEISQGKTLSDSMRKFPETFTQLFISMVKAGEESGTLAGSLKVVALQMDRAYSLQRKIKGAMMYPAVIVGVMILISILMLTYIVPTIMKTFAGLKMELPWTTQLIVVISDTLRMHGLVVFVVVALLFFLVRWAMKTEKGKSFVDAAITKIPIIGELVREVNAARTARTMSSLLSAGVGVVESVQITNEVIQNVHYKKILTTAEENIKKGAPMSEVFINNTKFYPVFVGEMIAVGEETGKVGEMLLSVAAYYEEDVEQKTKDMSTVIEPFLMVFIGAAVGFFALAMISPMYSLVNVV
jgi:type IV pilus assembly protein PilC